MLDLKLNKDYFQSRAGIFNVVLLVLNTINLICISLGPASGVGIFFMIVAVLGFIITGIFVLVYFFGVHHRKTWPWASIEIIYTETWVVLYIIASGLVLNFGFTEYVAAGILGLITAVVYIIKSFHVYVTEIVDRKAGFYVRT